MESTYREQFQITTAAVDCFGRLKPSWLLYYCQQVATAHSALLNTDLTTPEQQHLLWAITRNRVEISRLPRENEKITLETWPMPTTRVAYPRATVGYDREGQELFRCVGLWVLMDRTSRAMVVPGKSGVQVPGLIRGGELEVPGTLSLARLEQHQIRQAGFSELDANGHVNNTRYLDWVSDLLPGEFHRVHPVREITVCYLSEVLEGQQLDLTWGLEDGPGIRVDAYRQHAPEEKTERAFSARLLFA